MPEHCDEASPDASRKVPTSRLGGAERSVSAQRILWIDQAKGLAILLVVLYHSVFFMNAAGWGWILLTRANGALATFRMPLFFFASGLFFSRHLVKPARQVLTRRVLPMLWLYVFWSVVFAIFFSVVPWIRDPDREPLGDLPWILLRPSTELWFLYALTLYFVLTWVLNRALPLPAQLVVGLLIAVWAVLVDLPIWAFDDMARHYIVFLAAVHFSPVAFGFAERSTKVTALMASVGWSLLLFAREMSPATVAVAALIDLPLAFVAVAAGVALCAQLSGTRLGRFLTFLGSRTLSVYVLHVLVLGALFANLPTPAVVPWWLSLIVASGVSVTVAVVTAWVYPFGLRIPGVFRAPWISAPKAAFPQPTQAEGRELG